MNRIDVDGAPTPSNAMSSPLLVKRDAKVACQQVAGATRTRATGTPLPTSSDQTSYGAVAAGDDHEVHLAGERVLRHLVARSSASVSSQSGGFQPRCRRSYSIRVRNRSKSVTFDGL